MESYKNSGMTLRLTASVLTCFLCGIKRSYLVEAYDISPSQVDRLKDRVSNMRRQEAMQADYQNLIRESKHVMQTRFMTSGAGGLLDLFFQWDISTDELNLVSAYEHLSVHDVWDRLRQDRTTIKEKFDSKNAFILAAVDHFVADGNISNAALLEWMAALDLYYKLSTDEGQPENIHSEELTRSIDTLNAHIWDHDFSFLPLLHQFQRLRQQLHNYFFCPAANYVASEEFLTLILMSQIIRDLSMIFPSNHPGPPAILLRESTHF